MIFLQKIAEQNPIFTMSTSNPYAAHPNVHITASFEAEVDAMDANSPSNSSATTSSKSSVSHQLGQPAAKADDPRDAALNDKRQETIEFSADGPPSLNRPLTEEIFRSASRPHVFWANLRIPLPADPADPFEALYDRLVEFVSAMIDEDDNFAIFPYHLSTVQDSDDLLPTIDDPDLVPDDIDEWRQYFPDAKPRSRGGDLYTPVLVGFGKPFAKVMKALAPWFRKHKFGIWKSALQSEKPTSIGWLLFSTPLMDTDLLQDAIKTSIDGVPVGLRWKMILLGTQGTVPENKKIKALHVYVDELDVPMAKPLLMRLYASKTEEGHAFPLGIRMRLVPEIDTILNTKGRKNAEKLRACQNAWVTLKYTVIKTWEFELLDHFHAGANLSLREAIMSIPHPTNKKFTLFHSVDKSRFEPCHVLTVLKSAESYGRAMIAGLLPYLLWKFAGSDSRKKSIISQWFVPAARQRAEDAYWDPDDECVKNTSDLMLSSALAADDDALYWEQEDDAPKSPKRQKVHVEEESLNDSVSTIKTAVSTRKPKPAIKNNSTTSVASTENKPASAANTVTSQGTTLSQLTEQVSEIKQSHKTMIDRFDQLAAQMATLIAQAASPKKRPAGGHDSGSGTST